MKPTIKSDRAFNLVELLVVIAVMGILAALLLPVFSAAKDKAKWTTCLNNLRQINLGVRMYCDDSNDVSPATNVTRNPWIGYKELMKNYVGLNGTSSSQDRIFACPADTFFYEMSRGANGYFNNWTNVLHSQHDQAGYDYSSYSFNGLNFHSHDNPQSAAWLGIADRKITSIKDPVKTALVAETPAFYPYSWHQPRKPIQLSAGEQPMFLDAKDMVGFVDGHVSYIKIYYQEVQGNLFSCFYDPPAGYDYKWSGD